MQKEIKSLRLLFGNQSPADLSPLRTFNNLTAVELSQRKFNSSDCQTLGELKSLLSLTLNRCTVQESDFIPALRPLRRPALIIRAKKGVILVDKIYHGNKHGKNKY